MNTDTMKQRWRWRKANFCLWKQTFLKCNLVLKSSQCVILNARVIIILPRCGAAEKMLCIIYSCVVYFNYSICCSVFKGISWLFTSHLSKSDSSGYSLYWTIFCIFSQTLSLRLQRCRATSIRLPDICLGTGSFSLCRALRPQQHKKQCSIFTQRYFASCTMPCVNYFD